MTTLIFLQEAQPIKAEDVYETIVDDNIAGNGLFQFEYKQTWKQDKGYPDLFFEGTNHYSTSKEYGSIPASAVLRFYGKGVEVYGNKQDDNAIYDIYLDGEKVATFDGYAKTRVTKQLIYKVDSLEEKEHQVEIKTTNLKNKDCVKTAYAISIDYAKVFHGEMVPEGLVVDESVLLDANSTKQLKAEVTPYYATNKEIVWSSADETIATVDSKGLLSGVAKGKTVISATIKGTAITKTIPVTIRKSDYVLGASFGSTNLHYLQSNYKEITSMFQESDTNFGWRGDRINAEVVTWTKDKDINNVLISSSNFTSENNDVIDKHSVSINFLKETEAYTGRGGGIGKGQNAEKSPKVQVPDIIYNDGPIAIKSSRVQSAWINIDIPESAKPGTYSGQFTITADEMDEPITLNYEFTVYNLLQPKADEYQAGIELWEYPYAVAKYYGISDEDLYNEKHIEILKQNLKEYHDMGGNVITTAVVDYPWDRNNPYDYPSTIKWTKKKDGSFTYDFSQFDKWVQLNHDMGIEDKLKCFSMAPYHAMRYYDEEKGEYVEETTNGSRVVVGSDRWKEMWNQFLTAFVEHLDQKGWFDNTYIATDEVGEANIKEIYSLLQEHKNKDGKVLKLSAAVNYGNMTQDTLDKINDISINIEHIEHGTTKQREINEDRHSKGLTTSFYTCTGDYPNSFALSDPGESAWTIWYSATHSMDGYLRWSYDNWLQEPYTKLLWHSWEAGDTMLVYPDSDKTSDNPKLHSTPRWEKMKEGKRDIEKLFYIKKAYPELSTEVDTLVQSLGRRTGKRNAYNGMYASSQNDKDYIKAEVERMNAGLKDISEKAEKLVVVLNTSQLQTTIDKANELDKSLYTEDSYNVLEAALKSASEVKENPKTQDEIDDITAVLEDAISSLVYKSADYTKLEAELNRIPTDLSVYTEESRSALESAVAQIDRSKNITQQLDVDAYTKAVKDAIDNLKLLPGLIYRELVSDDGVITVKGYMHSDVTLEYKKYDKIEDVTKRIKDVNFMNSYKIENVYNINLKEQGLSYQPTSMLEVNIKAYEKPDATKTSIAYIDSKGMVQQISAKVDGYYISFTTNHFSDYAVIKKLAKGNDTGVINKPSNNVHTGDNHNMNTLIFMGICSLLILGSVTRKRIRIK